MGSGRWDSATRSSRFERRAYERAIDNALEQQLEGKISPEAVRAVETTVSNLSVTLDQVIARAATQFISRPGTTCDGWRP